jgi:hypothetical protein
MRQHDSIVRHRSFKAPFAVLAAVITIASPALAATWGIKFPGLATDVQVETTTPDAMSDLCKGRALRNKSVGFERPAQDKVVQAIVAKQSNKGAPLDEVTVRMNARGAGSCTLQLKSVMVTEWGIQASASDSKKSMERFTLAFAQAKVVQ